MSLENQKFEVEGSKHNLKRRYIKIDSVAPVKTNVLCIRGVPSFRGIQGKKLKNFAWNFSS